MPKNLSTEFLPGMSAKTLETEAEASDSRDDRTWVRLHVRVLHLVRANKLCRGRRLKPR